MDRGYSLEPPQYHNFSSENYHFYSREILQYIASACLRNDIGGRQRGSIIVLCALKYSTLMRHLLFSEVPLVHLLNKFYEDVKITTILSFLAPK